MTQKWLDRGSPDGSLPRFPFFFNLNNDDKNGWGVYRL
jgi:hypothetical protein